MFFGVLDSLELFYYALDDTLFSGSTVMFALSGCALFSLAKYLQDTFIYDELDALPERLAIDFIYDNVFAYIVCVVLFNAYLPIAGKINAALDASGFFVRLFIFLLVTAFIVVPAIPYLLYIIAYLVSVLMIARFAVYVENAITWESAFAKELVVYLVIIVLVLIMSFLVSGLLGMMIDKLKKYIVDTAPKAVVTLLKGLAIIAVVLFVFFFFNINIIIN